MVRFGLLSLALTAAFVLASVPVGAKDTFECEIKEQLDLTGAGPVRPNERCAVSGRFWLDKTKPLIAGAILPGEYPEWSVVKPGGPAYSFLMLGRPLGFNLAGLSFILYRGLVKWRTVPLRVYGPLQPVSGLQRSLPVMHRRTKRP
jgi:hypothetical protein